MFDEPGISSPEFFDCELIGSVGTQRVDEALRTKACIGLLSDLEEVRAL